MAEYGKLGILGFFLDRCFFLGRKPAAGEVISWWSDSEVIEVSKNVIAWLGGGNSDVLNFHRRKFGEKMKPFWRQAYFWKGLGWFNHQLVWEAGKKCSLFTFWKGVFKKGVHVLWGSELRKFFFGRDLAYHLEFVFFWGVASSHQNKRCNFQLMPVLFLEHVELELVFNGNESTRAGSYIRRCFNRVESWGFPLTVLWLAKHWSFKDWKQNSFGICLQSDTSLEIQRFPKASTFVWIYRYMQRCNPRYMQRCNPKKLLLLSFVMKP